MTRAWAWSQPCATEERAHCGALMNRDEHECAMSKLRHADEEGPPERRDEFGWQQELGVLQLLLQERDIYLPGNQYAPGNADILHRQAQGDGTAWMRGVALYEEYPTTQALGDQVKFR